MQRIPEPEELMDDAQQALAYAQADFSEANRLFVDLLEQLEPAGLSGRLLDLGCGPARQNLDGDPDAARRIELLCEYLPCRELASKAYDFAVSNSLLHHLTDPAAMWQTVTRCGVPGARVLVMDLARPRSDMAVDALVETHAMDAPEVLRRDFRNSLFAAYTVEEVEEQLRSAGLATLEVCMVSDRHLAVSGALP